MKKVLFLGLGHLGEYFLKHNKSHVITGSKRNPNADLDCEILPYTLGEEWTHAKDFDCVVVSFPPTEDYTNKLEKLLKDLAPFKQLIFVSSTSVFGNGDITEESEKTGDTRNANELKKAEALIETFENWVIVRPGGLIDSKRHPANFTKRISQISKSQTNVNLVHTEDVARFILFAIDHELKNESYNLVCDEHPTKEEFYGKLNPELTFDSVGSEYRVIDNSKSKNTGFTYQFPSLDW